MFPTLIASFWPHELEDSELHPQQLQISWFVGCMRDKMQDSMDIENVQHLTLGWISSLFTC